VKIFAEADILSASALRRHETLHNNTLILLGLYRLEEDINERGLAVKIPGESLVWFEKLEK
jgi:hypothetical protein